MTEDLRKLGQDLITISGRVVRWVPHQGFNLSLAATRTLAKLYDLGPTSISDLAISERSSQPTISNHVQRLETLGLVARKHSDTDARVWLITVTDRGLQELTAMRDQIGANIAPLLAELSESDRQAIRDGLDAIRRLLNGGS
ncbi:DNA-binding MarR family transcriptional regulator [Microlunatus panaciterrae]|uniref:DNA-binding MarR family transcriptional regulator n=1 Tax=Microlunatus panaciterrae TaxID=400768 RepID=A0ABS2RH08_9ACTN|nr:DNA-binding MarR family transcriptional regulator [Microlunatus panaciterrae]